MKKLAVACALLALSSCSDSESSTNNASTNNGTNNTNSENNVNNSGSKTGSQSYRDARAAVITDYLQSARDEYDQFDGSLGDLSTALQAWQSSPSSGAALDDARDAYRTTSLLWQRAEAWNIGPLTQFSDEPTPREEIYSWPITNTCRVDQELVAQSYNDSDAFAALLVNARGFDALEHLLWHPGTNGCPPQVGLDFDSIADLDARRAAYAVATVTDIETHSATLKSDFDAFIQTATSAPNDTYANDQAILNVLAESLLYIDTVVKDQKVGKPFGLTGCSTEQCLDDAEYPFADFALSAVAANLETLNTQLSDDLFGRLLDEVDASDIKDDMRASVQSALTIVNSEASILTLYNDRRSDGQTLFETIEAIDDRLKADFISCLDISLPETAPGDND